jgi:hypothetical protein
MNKPQPFFQLLPNLLFAELDVRNIRLLVFPVRTALKIAQAAKQEISRFSCKERTYMPGSKTTQGHPVLVQT